MNRKIKPKRKKCSMCEKMYTQTDSSVNDYRSKKCEDEHQKMTIYGLSGLFGISFFIALFTSNFGFLPHERILIQVIVAGLVLICTEYLFFKSDYKIKTIWDTVYSKIICLIKAFAIVPLPVGMGIGVLINTYKNIDGVIQWWAYAWNAWLFIIPVILLIVAYFGINHIIKKEIDKR